MDTQKLPHNQVGDPIAKKPSTAVGAGGCSVVAVRAVVELRRRETARDWKPVNNFGAMIRVDKGCLRNTEEDRVGEREEGKRGESGKDAERGSEDDDKVQKVAQKRAFVWLPCASSPFSATESAAGQDLQWAGSVRAGYLQVQSLRREPRKLRLRDTRYLRRMYRAAWGSPGRAGAPGGSLEIAPAGG
ncbi:hypothetical protein G7046_g6468 [Stylonectria norvegica]|nr:hypothetical protein G7046_g6468 [Stylonectria norvegica]